MAKVCKKRLVIESGDEYHQAMVNLIDSYLKYKQKQLIFGYSLKDDNKLIWVTLVFIDDKLFHNLIRWLVDYYGMEEI